MCNIYVSHDPHHAHTHNNTHAATGGVCLTFKKFLFFILRVYFTNAATYYNDINIETTINYFRRWSLLLFFEQIIPWLLLF